MIRPYLASDWSAICQIYDRAKPIELTTAGVAESFCPLDRDTDRKKDFADSTVLVADQDGVVRGFAGFRATRISWLYVEPEAFRKGLGRALLSHAIDLISGEPSLWTMEANQPAIRLYRSFGFEILERRDTHNRGFPCRAVKMRRKTTQLGATEIPVDTK